MDYYQFSFPDLTEEQQHQLLAMLSEAGFDGFEESASGLNAFIPIEKMDENSFNTIIELNNVSFSKSIIKETNWNAEWERDFEPVKVFIKNETAPFAYLRAGFHPADPTAKYDLLITPKMSFGTGHHATTFQVIELMSKIDFRGKKVIDFGTGTGILSILAEKMGAAEVLAIDNDDWSIRNTEENILANDCRRIRLLNAEAIPADENADIIVANINLNVILTNLENLRKVSAIGTIILFSGILKEDTSIILPALEAAGINTDNVIEKNNWLAIQAHI